MLWRTRGHPEATGTGQAAMGDSMDSAQRLKQMIDAVDDVVAFTGAGMSTDSGIPDFRSPTGIWKTQKPIQFQDFVASADVRRESWRRKFSGDRTLSDAQPNRGHHALARLVETGKVSTVITQNIDDLHRRSGIPADRIVELHGNAHHASCLSCGKRYELDALRQQFEATGAVADCDACGGIIKTATISFGQAMPEAEMERAQIATMHAELFLVLGSSLSVYPAAGFPELARRLGARLVIVNREPTPQDDDADLVIHAGISDVLAFAADLN